MSKKAENTNQKPNPITVTQAPDGDFVFCGRSLNIIRDKNKALEPYGKIILNYGQQLVLLPDDTQAEKIRQIIGCTRVVAND